LTQEVFRRAWNARHRYREQSSARAYLLRIADRLARNSRRVRRPVNLGPADWQQYDLPSPAAGPPEAAALAEEAQRLAALMGQLPPLQQRVLLLRYYGDLGFAEIAEIIGCPKNTALSHCRRGLETLRKLLVEKDEGRL
jgi:RNA polymerase sigma-70 factor (ECF subfamily)